MLPIPPPEPPDPTTSTSFTHAVPLYFKTCPACGVPIVTFPKSESVLGARFTFPDTPSTNIVESSATNVPVIEAACTLPVNIPSPLTSRAFAGASVLIPK